MKSFFQEYGGTIIASLVVVCLIAVCTVIKPLAAESHVSIVDKLSNYVEETLDNASENDLNSVLNLNGPTVNLISFTIETAHEEWLNGQHQAIDGMTWEQWVESDYNPIVPPGNGPRTGSKTFTISEGYVVSPSSILRSNSTYNLIVPSDIIVDGGVYSFPASGG